MLYHCPLCRSPRLHYALSRRDGRVVRCDDCRLMFLNPQQVTHEISPPSADDQTPIPANAPSEEVERLATRLLDQLEQYRGGSVGQILHIGHGESALSTASRQRGYAVTDGVLPLEDDDASSDRPPLPAGAPAGEARAADVCMILDVIENVPDPVQLLRRLRASLRPGGALFVSTPALGTRLDSADGRRRYFYFDSSTLWKLLYSAGYEHVLVFPRRQLADHDAMKEPGQGGAAASRLAPWTRLVPADLRQGSLGLPGGGLVAFATVAPEPLRRTLSVIVPAYNERATFEALMERLLHKEIADLDVEIIVVESNSTDGTRELAQRYAEHPRVSLILEERPRGKGHAVRAGMARATGDLVLIQDADLEYDIEDYDALLEPLLARRALFVLGARHGGQAWWKMRRFAEAPALSFTMNAGHRFFTSLVNLLFGLRLRDPFTMYKVFWRDCLFGLEFHRNRFDFDYELLVKLARKGCVPIEIPVNYRSRSYAEGKKVSLWRDPLSWLRALAELRFEHLRLVENAGRFHRANAVAEEERGS